MGVVRVFMGMPIYCPHGFVKRKNAFVRATFAGRFAPLAVTAVPGGRTPVFSGKRAEPPGGGPAEFRLRRDPPAEDQ